MVQRARLVQLVFKGWVLRKGDGNKWIEPCVPMIHLFWETKRPLLFTVIIAFLASIWREWVQVRECHSRGRRKKTFHPFVLITFVSLFLDLYSSPSNACHTDISNLGIHVFWVSHPCTQITATGRETKALIMHLNKQTDHDKLHFDLLEQNFPPLWIIAVDVICSLHCCHFRCTNLYNKNSSG